jgi:hypothetical protein
LHGKGGQQDQERRHHVGDHAVQNDPRMAKAAGARGVDVRRPRIASADSILTKPPDIEPAVQDDYHSVNLISPLIGAVSWQFRGNWNQMKSGFSRLF